VVDAGVTGVNAIPSLDRSIDRIEKVTCRET
jgi:hypothetical protein